MESVKCAACKIICIETIQGSKILNKVSSVKLCDLQNFISPSAIDTNYYRKKETVIKRRDKQNYCNHIKLNSVKNLGSYPKIVFVPLYSYIIWIIPLYSTKYYNFANERKNYCIFYKYRF